MKIGFDVVELFYHAIHDVKDYKRNQQTSKVFDYSLLLCRIDLNLNTIKRKIENHDLHD
jgi:hypothetical protein